MMLMLMLTMCSDDSYRCMMTSLSRYIPLPYATSRYQRCLISRQSRLSPDRAERTNLSAVRALRCSHDGSPFFVD